MPDSSVDPELERLWRDVLARWDDDGSHDRFVSHCREHARLAIAAGRYRAAIDETTFEYRGTSPRGRDAQRRLARVGALALADLEVERAPHGRMVLLWQSPRFRRSSVAVLVVTLLLALAFILRR